MISPHEEIRLRILEILYKHAENQPSNPWLERENLKKDLNVNYKILDFNILYLEEKGLLSIARVINLPFARSKITAYGIDVIERKENYAEELPFLKFYIQQIRGNVYGQVVQAVDSEVHITQIFQHAREITNKKTDITKEFKKEVLENIKSLEKEVKKEEPDDRLIKRILKWIISNATWLTPILQYLIKLYL